MPILCAYSKAALTCNSVLHWAVYADLGTYLYRYEVSDSITVITSYRMQTIRRTHNVWTDEINDHQSSQLQPNRVEHEWLS